MSLRLMALLGSIVIAIAAFAAEGAATYPSKPIRVVIGFSAGSGVDVSARVIAQKLNEAWGQPVVPDNRPGAGGTIAAGIVAAANPDGYTVISVSAGHIISPSPDTKKHWDAMGAEPLPMTPEQFDRYLAEQVGVIAKLVKTANIKIENQV